MRHGKFTKTVGMAIACASCWLSATSLATAGPVLDWLFPGAAARREARRASWSVPGTTTYHVPVTSYYGGYPAWNGGSLGYAQGAYAPTTAYRTVWAPVPVTTFSPVTYVNPLAPGSVADVQACTDYSWEARRVPYISYAPSAPTYPATTSYLPTSAPATYAIPSAVTTNYGNPVAYATPATTYYGSTSYYGASTVSPATYAAAPVASGCGYASGEAFSPTIAPQSYSAPQSCATTPGCSAPQSYSAAPIPPSYSDNGGTSPGYATTQEPPQAPVDSGVRADSAPTLLRPIPPANTTGPVDSGVRYQPPTNGFNARVVPVPAASSTRRSTNTAMELNPAYPTTPNTFQPQVPAQAERVQPIPDLERQRRAWELDREPRLFDQNDHTAQRSNVDGEEAPRFTAWEAVPIRWAVMSPQRDRETRVQAIPAQMETPPTTVNERPYAATSAPAPAENNWDVWRPSRD